MRFSQIDQKKLQEAIYPNQQPNPESQPVRDSTERDPLDRDMQTLPVSISKFPHRGSRYPIQAISLKTVSDRPAMGYLSVDYQYAMSAGIRNLINEISAHGLPGLLYRPISSVNGCLPTLLELLNPKTCFLRSYDIGEIETFNRVYKICMGVDNTKEIPPTNGLADREPLFEPFSLIGIYAVLNQIMDKKFVISWFHQAVRDPQGARRDLFNACASLLKVHSGLFEIKASDPKTGPTAYARINEWSGNVFKNDPSTGDTSFSSSGYIKSGLFPNQIDSILFRTLFSGNLSDLMALAFGVSESETYCGTQGKIYFDVNGRYELITTKVTLWSSAIEQLLLEALPSIISVPPDYDPNKDPDRAKEIVRTSVTKEVSQLLLETSIPLETYTKSVVRFTDNAINFIRSVMPADPFPLIDLSSYKWTQNNLVQKPRADMRYAGTITSSVLLAPCIMGANGSPEDDFSHSRFRISVEELLSLHSHGGLKKEFEMRPIVCSRPLELRDDGSIRAPDFSYINALNCVSEISFARVDAHVAVRGSLAMMAVRWDRFKRVLNPLKVGQNLLCDDYSNAFFYVVDPPADATAGELYALQGASALKKNKKK